MRKRILGDQILVTSDAGQFRLISENDVQEDAQFVPLGDIAVGEGASAPAQRLSELAQIFLTAQRRVVPGPLDYLILVPTLRCNLACSYCQVSRAALDARGYDWSNETLAGVLKLVAGLKARSIKIEFQGGEPTLRPDLIEKVMEAVPKGTEASVVICTNLQRIDERTLSLFDRKNVSIGTSLDGPLELRAKQRQASSERADRFDSNLNMILDRFGSAKVSALPTVDPLAPPEPDELIDAFADKGFESIYLRPINYQGFARKKHAQSRETGQLWSAYHERFIERLIERNFADRSRVLEETYFSLLLRRIFRPGSDRHVDLRNPNPLGRDYVVIDYDGRAYPTDEARMLSRSGVIDLSIGEIHTGWETAERDALDAASRLDGDPACERCAYKPYCGRDIVDDISRYGTIDMPREDTEFCRRHLALFDLAFRLIYSSDEKERYSVGRWLGLPGKLPVMEQAA
ncbi:radical SAM protein [Novosphingopyxis sp.]|uniref:radical SAM protein n=1 Tax=Novosphingopyxis sp. TaxID=2709690 RepID=UPI003B5BB6C5